MPNPTRLRRKALASCLAAALALGSAAVFAVDQPILSSKNNPWVSGWAAPFTSAAPTPLQPRANGRRNTRDQPGVTPSSLWRNGVHRDGGRRVTASTASLPARPAAVIHVTNCNDSGLGSLRQAALDAVSGDVIDLQNLTCSTISLTSGAIAVAADDVSLLGPGQNALTIDGDHADRVMNGHGLSITDLTIANGSGLTSYGYGGCIITDGNLTLTRTTVTGCKAGDGTGSGAFGGAVAVFGADLIMNQSTISHSRAAAADGVMGGGAFVYGNVILTDSTISNNEARADGELAHGGGLFAFGTVDLVNSRVIDNTTRATDGVAYGGGIYAGSDVSVIQSTISGNSAHSDSRWSYGGGINVGSYSDGGGSILMAQSTLRDNTISADCTYCLIRGGGAQAFGTISVFSSTISGNTAQSLGTAEGGALGGGLAILSDGSVIALYNSTLSGNAARGGEEGYGRGEGGGLSSSSAPFGLFNSTVTSNFASTRGGGASGGDNDGVLAPMLSSAIVAMNQAPVAADLMSTSGPLTVDGEHSLVMSADADMTLPADTLSSDPKLLPLSNNGGATATHALAACSPAIDTGVMNPWEDQFDQRGNPFLRDYGAAIDIGAFERQPDTDRIFDHGFDASPCP